MFSSIGEACGPYGHDIHLREICAAWKRPPITEMTREEYESWLRVEKQVMGYISSDDKKVEDDTPWLLKNCLQDFYRQNIAYRKVTKLQIIAH